MVWEAKFGVANIDKQNKALYAILNSVPQQVLQLMSVQVSKYVLEPTSESFKLGQFEKHKC